MPTSLYVSLHINHKSLKLTALLLLSPLLFFAQSLTGLWTGVLSNDSNSVRKDQSFEIALTEYRGKVYGYSRSEFIVNDTLYYIVKRVKGTINGDICEVTDDEIISFNFPTRIDKGVKVSSNFYRNKKDSTWYLAGTWKTNKTKNYYSVTGKVDMKEEKDLSASKIFPHLEELNLANDVAFYKDRKKEKESFVVKTVKAEKKNTEPIIKDAVAISSGVDSKTEDETIISSLQKPGDINAVTKTIINNQSGQIKTIPLSPIQGPIINNESNQETITQTQKRDDAVARVELRQAPEKKMEPVKNEETKLIPTTLPTSDVVKNNDDKKQEPVSQINKNDAAIIKSESKQEPEKQIAKKEEIKLISATTISTRDISKNNDDKKQEPVSQINKNDVAISKTGQQQMNKTDIANTTKTTSTVAPSSVKQTDTEIKKNENSLASGTNSVIAPINSVNKNKEIKKQAAVTTIIDNKDIAEAPTAAILVKERKSEFSQIVNFKSDSLELALYDNGEIDGDTVSVMLNGEIIIAKQCLKATAYKKTIYITPGDDAEFTMVLYAENLGKYPPNTGLLVVHDGDDVYNVHFSADFQKNAGVVFRRKK